MQSKPVVAGDAAARVIDARTAYVMNDMLRGVATSGTGARATRELKRNDIAGKTGTTNESHDAWFAGYTPDKVAVVWMGFDQPRSLGSSETGGGLALPIWIDYMRFALKNTPVAPPPPPPPGLNRIDGDYYFAEYPPGQAIARVGLTSPTDALLGPGGSVLIDNVADHVADGIGDLLNQLGGNRGRSEQDRVPF